MESGMMLNYILGLLMKKVVVPSGYHDQVDVVKIMQEDDVSGLVDSLTDFSVETACVDFDIETSNEEFTKILKKWLDTINADYNGQIPSGIKALAKEYFKERWKYSSFPILKIAEWKVIDKILVPSKMFFVDGASIYSKDKDEDSENLNLINYDYYLGSARKNKLNKNVVITKPYGRWFDEYPTPYLIKRGIYHNWKIIHSLKDKELTILDQIIPYLLLIKKGSAELLKDNVKSYKTEELNQVIQDFQGLMDKIKSSNLGEKSIKTPIRATQFDEEITHLIPDLKAIFQPELFAVAEKNILSGLGFIDIAEAVTSSRKESVLNPKAFIEEARTGVNDFKQIIKELVLLIKSKNKRHKKYINSEITIVSSPIHAFMTDDFRNQLRMLWERGQLSDKTYCEIVGEVDFKTEVFRREKEAKDGTELTMYPHITKNTEADVSLTEEKRYEDIYGKPIPVDKIDDPDKYDLSKKELEGAPYKNIKDLPSRVKDNLDSDLQSVFLRIFNRAYQTYKNDTQAFRVAWSVIKQIGRKGKDGKWHRKKKRIKGQLRRISITKSIIDEAIQEVEKVIIDNTLKMKELEIANKKNILLENLTKGKKRKGQKS